MSERHLRVESIPGGRPAVIDIASGQPLAGVSVVGVLARDGKVVAMLQVEGVELRTMLMAEPDAFQAFGAAAKAAPAIAHERQRRQRAEKVAGGGRRSKKTAGPKPPQRKAAPVAATRDVSQEPVTAADLVENAGITVCTAAQRETIAYADREIDLKDRQASFLAALVTASPSPVARDFIARRVWAGRQVPEFAEQILGTMAGELREPLALIGLQIKTVRGVGIALQPGEA